MLSKLRDKAKRITEDKRVLDVKDKGTEILEQQVPRIRCLIREKVGPKLREAIQDDELMIEIFSSVYEIVTLDRRALRFLIKRDHFVNFCLKNRDRLIDQYDSRQLVGANEQQTENPKYLLAATDEEDTMAKPATCVLCNQRVEMRNAPLEVKMMVFEGLAPLICRSCVVQQRIAVEVVGPQERIWYDGEKYLGYEDNFVRV